MKKQMIAALVVFALVLTMVPLVNAENTAAADDAATSIAEESTVINQPIHTVADLIALRNQVNNFESQDPSAPTSGQPASDDPTVGHTYTLAADLTISAADWVTGIGVYPSYGQLGVPFRGVFDGAGHTITFSGTSVGLLGVADIGATVKNLTIAGSMTGGNVAGIASEVVDLNDDNGDTFTVDNCVNKATITGETAGGLVACHNGYAKLAVTNCYNEGAVTASQKAGGLIGEGNVNMLIEHCFNMGSVNGIVAGGVCGFADTGEIKQCYDSGSVTGTTAGALLGQVFGSGVSIADSYAVDKAGVSLAGAKDSVNVSGSYYCGQDSSEPVGTQVSIEEMVKSDWGIGGTWTKVFGRTPQLAHFVGTPASDVSTVVAMEEQEGSHTNVHLSVPLAGGQWCNSATTINPVATMSISAPRLDYRNGSMQRTLYQSSEIVNVQYMRGWECADNVTTTPPPAQEVDYGDAIDFSYEILQYDPSSQPKTCVTDLEDISVSIVAKDGVRVQLSGTATQDASATAYQGTVTLSDDYQSEILNVSYLVNRKTLTQTDFEAMIPAEQLAALTQGETYTGRAVTKTLSNVKDEIETLTENVDYTLTYANNVNITSAANLATVTVDFIKNYTGSFTYQYPITFGYTGASVSLKGGVAYQLPTDMAQAGQSDWQIAEDSNTKTYYTPGATFYLAQDASITMKPGEK